MFVELQAQLGERADRRLGEHITIDSTDDHPLAHHGRADIDLDIYLVGVIVGDLVGVVDERRIDQPHSSAADSNSDLARPDRRTCHAGARDGRTAAPRTGE